jgi:hypothetical protein
MPAKQILNLGRWIDSGVRMPETVFPHCSLADFAGRGTLSLMSTSYRPSEAPLGFQLHSALRKICHTRLPNSTPAILMSSL